MKLLIPDPVVLRIDPDNVTDPQLQAVIADDLAWLIWLCWRPRHIVSEVFGLACLTAARQIRRHNPDSWEAMVAYCFPFCSLDFTRSDLEDWGPQFWLYYRGHERLRVVIKT